MNNMFYVEFKQASKKHLETCICIKRVIDSDCNCHNNKTHLLSNLFYLSGYVIETILKYGLCKSINYDRTKPISLLEQDGISFKDDIKKHSLIKLKNKLQSKSNFEILKKNPALFQEWESEVRYVGKVEYDNQKIFDFFNYSKNLYEELYKY